MTSLNSEGKRRAILRWFGVTSLGAVALGTQQAAYPQSQRLHARDGEVVGVDSLSVLLQRLASIRRRRDFKTVPFMLTERTQWDYEAASELLAYRYPVRQVWESTDFSGPWLNLMRESMNGQIFAHGHEDFIAVSATHGSAHLALFNQEMWDKYSLATLAKQASPANRLIIEAASVSSGDDRQNVDGYYGPGNNNITSLQRRGAVFIACHDSIHAVARSVQTATAADMFVDGIAADLTNNLIPGAILVPSAVAFIAELQRRGYSYAKAS
ncbi:transcriptional initiation protein Tat [Paraburkholderia tropica]|uniref:thiosulfate dehydrogenase n=1 Tax=Paraburkholderia tropica TaxID=92647 RepID=UPI003D2B5DA3